MALRSGKNIRLFKNPILEKLTYVPPWIPISFWGPVITWGVYSNLYSDFISSSLVLKLFFAGLLVWTLAEYVLHRYVFHFKPRGPIQERLAFLIHGIHHDDPEDQRRLLMPPLAAVVFAAFFFVLFHLFLGEVFVKSFFSGFLTGYLLYDYIHFATHFIRPKNRILKALKQNHMQHHFVKSDKLFGVSNPLWDYIFQSR